VGEKVTERYVGFIVKDNKFTGDVELTTGGDKDYSPRVILTETLINKAVKLLEETHKTKEFYSVSGILICATCIEKKSEFKNILDMTLEQLAETDNAYIPDVTAYFEDVSAVVFMCSECKLTWSKP